MGMFDHLIPKAPTDAAPNAQPSTADSTSPASGENLFQSEIPNPGFVGALKRGFKRTIPETKALLAGAGAAVAGAVGADGVRDSLLGTYQDIQRTQVDPLANKSGFIDSVTGNGSIAEWAGDTLGNFGGQAVQSLAAGAAGAVAGSVVPGAGTVAGGVGGVLARGVAKKAVEEAVAGMVAKGVATDVARKAVLSRMGGAALATTGLNVGQEVGIGFTGRAEDAAAAGQELNQQDALRAIGYGVPAGLLDTAAEALTAGRLVRGGPSASPNMLTRVAAGAGTGAASEGATEGAQAVLERAGAARALTGEEAYKDYVENVAAGMLGGSVPGAAGGIRRPDLATPPPPAAAPNGPLTRAAATLATPPAVTQPTAMPPAATAPSATTPPIAAAAQTLAAPAAAPAPAQQPVAAQPEVAPAAAAPTAPPLPDSMNLYQSAMDAAVKRGITSIAGMAKELGVPRDQAKSLIAALETASVLSKPDERKRRRLLIDPTTGALIDEAAAKADRKDAAKQADLALQQAAGLATPPAAPVDPNRPDPANGPLSAAGASAVDTGAAAAVQAQQAADAEQAAQPTAADQQRAQREQLTQVKLDRQAQALDAQAFDEADLRALIEADFDAGKKIDSPRMMRLAKQAGVKPRVVDNLRRSIMQERASGTRPAISDQPIDAEFTDITDQAAPAMKALPAPTPNIDPRAAARAFPFANEAAAKASADRLAASKGKPYAVAPHPNAAGKWVVVPERLALPAPNTSTNSQNLNTLSPTGKDSAPVAGEPIDKKWTAFAPESGTLGVPRSDMPQIKAPHRGALVNFLNARGIGHESEQVPATDLKPTQAEFAPKKVEKAAKHLQDTGRSILVSQDNHVLDGHHQWMAARNAGLPVNIIRLHAPIAELLAAAEQFPSSSTAAGSTAATQQAQAADETYDTSTEVLDSDLTPPSGGAFSVRGAAESLAKRTRGGKVFEVDGGFVVRTPRANSSETSNGSFSQAPVKESAPVAAAQNATEPTDQEQGNGESKGQGQDGRRRQGREALLGTDGAAAGPLGSAAATHKDPGQPAEPATATVIAEAAKTADASPRVTMAEARTALLAMVDEAIVKAPTTGEGSWGNPTTSPPRTESGWKVRDVSIDREDSNGLDVPRLKITQKDSASAFFVQHGANVLGQADNILGARLLAGRLLMGAEWSAKSGPAGSWTFKEAAPPDAYATFKVPGDGQFKVLNTRERLQAFRKQIEQNFNDRKRDSFGFEPLPSTRMPEAQRTKVLADAEAETDAVDAKPRTAPAAPDLQGFTLEQKDGAAFDLIDGNMRVSVVPMAGGKFQASFRGAKSSPHLQSRQAAIDWAAGYRDESKRIAARVVQPEAATGPADAKGERKFYVTMIRDSKVARIAGPFDTKEEADAILPAARDRAKEVDPRAVFDAFGVSAVTMEKHKPAALNEQLGIAKAAAPEIPDGYKPTGEPYYSNGKDLVQGYAKFPQGDRVKLASGIQGVVTGHIGKGPVYSRTMVKFDNGTESGVDERELVAVAPAQPEKGIVGRRADGVMIREDERGVRWYAQGGVRIFETVSMRPTRQGMQIDRGVLQREFMTAEESAAAAKDAAPTEQPKAKPTPSANTIVTDADAEAARARLKAKFNRLNSGIDPEMMLDGITLGMYHIERGARTFAAYAKAMVDDLGDAVKPYLKSWYMGVKYDPRAAGFDGMDSAASVESAVVDSTPEPEQDSVTEDSTDAAPDQPSPKALDSAPAEEGSGTAPAGETGVSPPGGGQTGVRSDSGAATVRVPPTRGGRGGTVGVSDSKTGATGGGRRGSRRTARAGAGVSEDDAGLTGEQTLETAQPPNIPAINFKIGDDTGLGKGGEVAKFKDNVEAIRTLKLIESERRRATPDEQRALARWVGWGGLASAFPNPETGKFKDGWEQRGNDLRDMLTPSEYRAARRSTRNAHFTSEVVVNFMWDAVRRLGYRNGLALESSMGSGNFVGLMPDDIAARFIGVEYDSITARLAGALYPQATVLHSGFQDVPLPDGTFDLNIGNPPFGSESLRFQFKPELRGLSIHNQFFLASLDALKAGGLQVQVVSSFLMDAQDKTARQKLADKADLVAAFRLPDTAFKENARTEVVTDILILRKRASPLPRDKDNKGKELPPDYPAWVNTDTVPDPLGGEAIPVNTYFKANPDHIIGTMDRSGKMRAAGMMNVHLDDPSTLGARLKALLAKVPQNVVNTAADVAERTEQAYTLLGEAMRISVAREEPGHMAFSADGKLTRVIEREHGEGTLLQRQDITADSPWSAQLFQDSDGRWYKVEVQTDEEGKAVKVADAAGAATRFNAYTRKVYATEAEIPSTLRLGKLGFERMTQLVNLRDLLKNQLVLETEDATKVKMEANRAKLAAAYKAYVEQHGPVNRRATAALVGEMPDGGLLLALESSYEPERTADQAKRSGLPKQSEMAKPAAILSERVVPKYEPVTKAETPADALAITLAERGVVDIEHIAKLLGQSPEDAAAALTEGDKPLVFKDPELDTYETADAYLSGQVTRKLMAAQAAGLTQNAKALQAVQPERWGAENVSVQVGAAWVPPAVYADFAAHLMGGSATASFSPITNTFTVAVKGTDKAKADQWGTDHMTGIDILARLLNSQTPSVTYRDRDGTTHVDKEATTLAILKGREIVSEFGDWIFKDGARREQLVDIFNQKFNTRVSRQYDGQHLKLPGKVPDAMIQMRRHQKNAIWRGISSKFLLIDHVVGAGKTFTAIARAMERRRMGLAQKPTIVVPNHLVEQWQADVYRLYPGAKVLAATKKDFEKKNRRRLLSRVATGDYDIVILPHSSFGFVGISPETELRYLDEDLQQAIQAVADAQAQAEEDGDVGYRKPLGVKEAERLVTKIQERMDKLREGARDRLLTFEQLGIDDLTIDEAHEFKNLFYSSRLTKVRGMGDKVGSRKAADLYNKVRVVRDSAGSVVFMTGTPVSNSVVELYTMMRYLAAPELKELGMEHFDAWRSQFVDATPAFEPNESGRLQEVTRLGRSWSNMRSLMDLYYSFTDAVTIDDIKQWFAEDNDGKAFPVPNVKGGDRQLRKVMPTPAQESVLAEVIAGFDSLDGIKDQQERNAARLRLMDRARKLSLDVRAVDPRAQSKEEGGKLELLSAEVKRIYDRWTPDRGTQLVFLDRSVPKAKGDDKIIKEYDTIVARRDKSLKDDDEVAFQEANEALERYDADEIRELRSAQAGGWNAYQQIKDNLVALGIPAAEIRFVQEANTDEQKQALFDAVNGGKVRVLIGSTPRMGAGTNVQKRLVALHHADVTWKPSDIEQREGRIIRQGNDLLAKYGENFEVDILAYATERTVDAKMWSLNAAKLRPINGLRKYTGDFTMEFEDADSVSMAEMAAEASGNPLLLERVTLESEIGNLELQEKAHRRKRYGIEDALERAQRIIDGHPARIEQARTQTAVMGNKVESLRAKAAKRSVVVEGKTYTDAKSAMKAALDAVERQQDGNEKARYGITINGERVTSKDAIDTAIGQAIGDHETFEVQINGATYTQRTAGGRAAAEIISPRAADALEQPVSGKLGSMMGMDLLYQIKRGAGSKYRATSESVNIEVWLEDAGQTVASADIENHGAFLKLPTATMRDALGKLASRIESAADPSNVTWLESELARAKREVPELAPKLKEPFAKAQEIQDKRARLNEVVGILSAAPPTAPAQPAANVESAPARTVVSGRPYFRNLGGEIEHEPNAKKIELSEMPDGEFYIAPGLGRDSGQFEIMEATTGLRVGLGKTRKAAIEAANKAIVENRSTIKTALEQRAFPKDKLDAAIAKLDGGNRASFAKADKPNAPGARGMPEKNLTRLLATAKQAMALLGVNIEVVANGSDLPAEITAQDDYDDTVQAAITGDRKTVYFVASRIASPRAAMKLVAHELVGHMSMEQLLGKRWPELRDAIKRLHDAGKWPEVFAEVSRRYERNADGTFRPLDDATFAAEAIAVFAEKNIQTSILQRALNALRGWLRKFFPQLNLRQGELRQMLWEAGQYLEGKPYRPDVAARALGQWTPKTAQEAISGLDPEQVKALIDRQAPPREGLGASVASFAKAGIRDTVVESTGDYVAPPIADPRHGEAWYHGRPSNESARTFDDGRPSFFSRDRHSAEWYASEDGRVTDHRVAVSRPAHLRDLQETLTAIGYGTNPMDDEKLANDIAKASPYDGTNLLDATYIKKVRDALESRGFDSVIAYDTIENTDTEALVVWDSRRIDPPKASFAKAGTMVDRLQDLINPKDTTLLERIKNRLSDWRPAALGALQLRHLGELAEDILPPVATYSQVVQRMATMRNELQELGHDVVDAGMKYQGANPEESKKLFRMLHDATLAGVDPAETHKPLQMMDAHYRENVDVTPENVRAFLQTMKGQAKLNPGSAVVYINRAKEARKMLNQERRRAQSHREMFPKFARLSPDAKKLWVQMRDAYRTQSAEYEKALMSRIEALDFDKAQKASQIARMRLQFEAARVPFYVPLARWGEYWVSGTNADGQREFYMQESAAAQEKVRKELAAQGYQGIAHGVKLDTVRAQDGASASFMADMDEMLKKSGAPDKIRDEAFQLYLRSLPDLSIRTNFIHRKGTPGYSQDALRALAGHIFHGSFQIARLRYSHELEAIRTEAEGMAKAMSEADDAEANAAGNIVNELKRRHEWVMNPQDNPLTNKISSVGFVYYLGLTPAAALVNLLQTPMVAFPVLAAKHKVADVTRELWRAMRQSVGTYGHMQKQLTGDELEAHTEFGKRGVFDKTQSANLAGISESDTHAYSPRWHKVMSVISHLFHKGEVINREATAMAAYRLERAAGAGHVEAIEAADRSVHEAHFDYSNANRARYMQSAPAKVLLMFRQYSLAVTWLLGRNLWQSIKGLDAATRTAARRKLAGVLGMTALFSGTLGLPLLGTVGGVMNALAAAFGDDDEPWDWETEFRAFLRDLLGDTGAEAILRGPVQAATGIGIASRVSMSDLWFREPDRELEGRAWSNYLFEQAAGPMGGLITNFFRGQQLMSEGQVWRGVETIMPKAIKDAMKSVRYLDEGVNNLRGDAIVEDLNIFESLAQVSGFSPASVATAYDTARDVKNYEQAILDRRSRLMDAFALAWRLGDVEGREQVLAKMRKFSQTYPELAITGESIKRSLTARARASAQAENGVIVDKRIRARLEARLGQ